MSDLKPYQFEPKRSQPKQPQLQCDRCVGVTLIVNNIKLILSSILIFIFKKISSSTIATGSRGSRNHKYRFMQLQHLLQSFAISLFKPNSFMSFSTHSSHDLFLLPRSPLSSTFQSLQSDNQSPFPFV